MTIYAAAMRAAGHLLARHLHARAARGKEVSARLGERQGHASRPRPDGRLVWLHAASVGESVALLSLIKAIGARFPLACMLVTTGTVTSAEIMDRRLPPAAFHQFLPLDHPEWVSRFLDHWRPDAAIWTESELWPNFLEALHRRRIPTAMVNGRLSARSAQRWRLVAPFARRLLGSFTIRLAQSEADAARLSGLGPSFTHVGNLKMATAPAPVDGEALARLRAAIGDRPVWLAANTHPEEEAMLLSAHAELASGFPRLLTIMVPRHPARGAVIAMAANQRGFCTDRRCEGALPDAQTEIYVADTLGELGIFYTLSPVVYLGGGFGQGGHNPIEAAQHGAALVIGPDTRNNADIAGRALALGAARQIAKADDLAPAIAALLANPAAFAMATTASRTLASEGMDVLPRIMTVLEPLFAGAGAIVKAPRFWSQPPGILTAILSPLGALYAATTARRVRRSGWHAPVPIIAIGNLTAGGGGKTPLALALAETARLQGIEVHCLSRGYGGRLKGPITVDLLSHDAAAVGDEPLLLAAVAPTWIACDREAGARAAVAAGAQLLILDDALQNAALHKDLTLLAIDAGSGFGNGRVIPAGPLREAIPAGLARCDAVVLIGKDILGIAQAFPEGLPVYTARMSIKPAIDTQPYVAFAGIARPDKFRVSLVEAGYRLDGWLAFGDHHVYAASELASLRDMARELKAKLITTTKDQARLSLPDRAGIDIAEASLLFDNVSVPTLLIAAAMAKGPKR